MANSYPWSRWFWSDWQNDPNLRRCSKAAKGFWMDLLSLMHECEEPGVMATNGVPWTNEHIASAIVGDPAENLGLLNELIDMGVPSRDEHGAIYSRRMVRDAEISRVRAEAGSKGGSKQQAKPKQSVKQPSDSDSESESESESSNPIDDIWNAAPEFARRRSSRRQLESEWRLLRPKPDVQDVLRGLSAWITSEDWKREGGKYVPGIHRWLKNRKWEEPPAKPVDTTRTQQSQRIAKEREAAEKAHVAAEAERKRIDDFIASLPDDSLNELAARVRAGPGGKLLENADPRKHPALKAQIYKLSQESK
jgi:hypothetical protein